MYFHDTRFEHVGFWMGHGRVVSKWGIGYLYEHELLDVPASYGNNVAFYKQLSPEDAYYHFTLFAEERGIQFESPSPEPLRDACQPPSNL